MFVCCNKQTPITSSSSSSSSSITPMDEANFWLVRPIRDRTYPMILIDLTKVHFLLLIYGTLRKSPYSIREMWPFNYDPYLNIPICKSMLFNSSVTFVSLTWYISNDVHFLKTFSAVSVAYLLCCTAQMSQPFINVSTATFLRGFICKNP